MGRKVCAEAVGDVEFVGEDDGPSIVGFVGQYCLVLVRIGGWVLRGLLLLL